MKQVKYLIKNDTGKYLYYDGAIYLVNDYNKRNCSFTDQNKAKQVLADFVAESHNCDDSFGNWEVVREEVELR